MHIEDVKLETAVAALLAISDSPRLCEAERGLVISTADLLRSAVAPTTPREAGADPPVVPVAL
jgi:hypothetical protein